MGFLAELLDIIYLKKCVVCNIDISESSNEFFCLDCEQDIPYSYHWNWEDNPAEKKLWGKFNFEKVCSLMLFKQESDYRNILYQIKYKGNKKLAFYLGQKLGENILSSDRIKKIDFIVPIPLHFLKKFIRGYNQSFIISCGIASVLHIPVSDNFVNRHKFTKTQTRKDKISRWKNVERAFSLNKKHVQNLENKHILIVDDVLTTGATIEAVAQHLLAISGVKISISTLAYAE